jgi:hypothetical protein
MNWQATARKLTFFTNLAGHKWAKLNQKIEGPILKIQSN